MMTKHYVTNMAAEGIASVKYLSLIVFFQVIRLTVADQIHYEAAPGLVCDACEPGTHLVADCTETTPTQCKPCVAQQNFVEQYTRRTSCLPCSIECYGSFEELVVNCTVTKDRVCGCKEGYFRRQQWGQCQRHTPCALGFGVKQLGSRESDTQCERCPNGYYSDIESLKQRCKKHTNCSAQGLVELMPGSRFSDVQCAPCSTAASSNGVVCQGDQGTVSNNNTNIPTGGVSERPDSQHGAYIAVGVVGFVIVILLAGYCCYKKCRTGDRQRCSQIEP